MGIRCKLTSADSGIGMAWLCHISPTERATTDPQYLLSLTIICILYLENRGTHGWRHHTGWGFLAFEPKGTGWLMRILKRRRRERVTKGCLCIMCFNVCRLLSVLSCKELNARWCDATGKQPTAQQCLCSYFTYRFVVYFLANSSYPKCYETSLLDLSGRSCA